MIPHPITEDDLQAYVDGVLGVQRASEVTAYLAAHPDVAARVEAYAQDRALLRAALAPVAAEPIPAQLGLDALAAAQSPGRRDALRSWRAAAAAVVLLAAGAGGGWILRDLSSPPRAGIASLAQEAADSYAVYAPDLGRPVEMDGSQRALLVKWASSRLERPVPVPDLTASGFQFIGGRLVATPHGPAVLYMFDNGRGARLVMLLRNMAIDKNAAMAEQPKGDVTTVSWSRDGLGFSLVGPLAPSSLHPIASHARRQMEAVT